MSVDCVYFRVSLLFYQLQVKDFSITCILEYILLSPWSLEATALMMTVGVTTISIITLSMKHWIMGLIATLSINCIHGLLNVAFLLFCGLSLCQLPLSHVSLSWLSWYQQLQAIIYWHVRFNLGPRGMVLQVLGSELFWMSCLVSKT